MLRGRLGAPIRTHRRSEDLIVCRAVRDDERGLLEAWKAGDDAALQTLVRRYFPDIQRFFLTACGGDLARAEDLTQDTFLTVVRRRDDIEESFRAFCYGVARMKRFEAGRQRQRRADESPPEDGLELEAPAGLSEAERERSKIAIAVLRRLEPDDQLLLILKDYLGFTQPELAETFKIPQTRVAGRINRARLRFRREFEAMEMQADERELTMRSLGTALASIVARLPADLVANPE